MDKFIFDKTDKGREEIATRKYGLAPRMRSLLVLVDGKKNKAELIKKVAGLGLNGQSIDELVENNFIENTSGAPAAAPIPVVAATPAAPVESPAPPAPEPVEIIPEPVKIIGPDELAALHTFLNETIKSTIGLRGFSLQQKAEHATTLDDFRDLRQPYLEAVLKAKGREMTISLRDRLDQLLDNAEKSAR